MSFFCKFFTHKACDKISETCGKSSFNLKRTKVFFVTLVSKGGHFDPPANSETKEARTMKPWTVIACYITSITKELKFFNAHCSIVYSYCSVVCLMANNELKNDRIFKFFEIKRNSHSR